MKNELSDLERINDCDEILERMRREDMERSAGAIRIAMALAVVMWVATMLALIFL